MFRKNNNILSTELDGEICLFHTETSDYLNLNSTASYIWLKTDNTFSNKFLIELLLEEFEIDVQTCKEETKKFIKQCLEFKMIEKI